MRFLLTIAIPVDDLQRYSLRRGDLLMNEGGDYYKLGRGHVWQGEIETCIHQNHVFAVHLTLFRRIGSTSLLAHVAHSFIS